MGRNSVNKSTHRNIRYDIITKKHFKTGLTNILILWSNFILHLFGLILLDTVEKYMNEFEDRLYEIYRETKY